MKQLFIVSARAVAVAAFNNTGIDTCAVIVVKGKDGDPMRVDKAAYDANPDDFELYSPAKKEAADIEGLKAPQQTAQPDGTFVPPLSPAAVNPNPAPYAVTTDGTGKNKRAYIVDSGTGKRIENMTGVDVAGYDNEAKAWEAILALQPSQSNNFPPVVTS